MKNFKRFVNELFTLPLLLLICGFNSGTTIEKSKLIPWNVMSIVDIVIGSLSLLLSFIIVYKLSSRLSYLRQLERYLKDDEI